MPSRLLLILAVVATSLASQPRTGVVGWYGLFMAIPVYVVSAILIVPPPTAS